MTQTEALKLALEALEATGIQWPLFKEAITAIREALAQPEQEPVAWRWKERINNDFDSWVISASEPPPYAIEQQPLYTAPPQRKPLTDEDLRKLADKHLFYQSEGYEVSGVFTLARAIEAAHGIKE